MQQIQKIDEVNVKLTDCLGNGISGNGIAGNGMGGNGVDFDETQFVIEDLLNQN